MSEKKASAHDLFNQGLPDRFWNKVMMEPNSGCWIWMGGCDTSGYGCFWSGIRDEGAHRVSYVAHKGKIPDGLQIDHLCRIRNCVNPNHLEPVSRKENIRRGKSGLYNKKKTHCPKNHPYDSVNTYVGPDGKRECRECKRNNMRKYRAKRKLKRQTALADTNGTQP